MNWKNLFSPVPAVNAGEARRLIGGRPEGELQLLDVRQPGEYRAGHLPGGILIPLKELPDRLSELDPGKPVLVYCAVGGRSLVAAQLLNGQGFTEVYNLSGGIKAWQAEEGGATAVGPAEAGLQLLPPEAEYDQAAALAYAMEEGLRKFYQGLADQATDDGLARLYRRLAGFEEGHMARLAATYQAQTGRPLATAAANREGAGGDQADRTLLEGGSPPPPFPAVGPTTVVLHQAMSLEVQALDLYLRLARQSRDQAGQQLFLAMAAEEKEHLALLARESEGS